MYESTMVALQSLYPKLSPGGYLIVDDYGAIEDCKQAATTIAPRMQSPNRIDGIDHTGVYWQRTGRAEKRLARVAVTAREGRVGEHASSSQAPHTVEPGGANPHLTCGAVVTAHASLDYAFPCVASLER